MKEKRLVLILIFALVLSFLLSVFAGADAQGTCGEEVTWKWTESTGTLTISGTGKMKDYSISTVPWSAYQSDIKTVSIGSGVTRVGSFAFYGATALTAVSLPNTVAEIGVSSFSNCSALPSISLPSGLTTIERSAFSGCSGLTGTFIIPAALTKIDYYALDHCTGISAFSVAKANTVYSSVNGVLFNKDMTKLIMYPKGKTAESYTVPDTVQKIESDAFSQNTSLSTVVIPENVTTLGIHLFDGCSSLASVTVAARTTALPYNMFDNCTALKTVTLPDCIKTIGSYAFGKCSALETITLPDCVEKIELGAFDGCSSLTNFHWPEGLKSIGTNAFASCSNITEVYLSSVTESVAQDAFNQCAAITRFSVPEDNAYYRAIDGVLFTRDGCTLCMYPKNSNTAVYRIPDGVTTILPQAFSCANKLEAVIFPSSLEEIPAQCCYNSGSLNAVYLPGSVSVIGANAFYKTALKTVYYEYNEADIQEISGGASLISGKDILYEIPEDELCILTREASSFGSIIFSPDRAIALAGDTISLSAQTNAGSRLLSFLSDGCEVENNTLVVTGDHVISAVYESAAEFTLVNVTGGTITPPDGTYFIGDTVTLEQNPQMGYKFLYYLIDGNPIPGSSFPVTGNHTISAAYQAMFSGTCLYGGECGTQTCWCLDDTGKISFFGSGTLTAASSSDSSSESDWYPYRSSIYSAVIDEGITEIGASLLSGCSNLCSVTIPEGLEVIREYAFYNCKSLQEVDLPDSVTQIYMFAFEGCTGLKSVRLSDSLKNIYNQAFRGCTSLTGVVFPDTLDPKQGLCSYSFDGCSSLRYIVLPKSISTLSNNIFSGCTSLKSVFYLGSESDWEKISISSGNEPLTSAVRHCVSAFHGCYSVTVTTENGTVTGVPADCTATLGETITLKAVPDRFYSFAGYSLDGEPIGTNSTATFTVTGNHSIEAFFTKLPLTGSIAVSGTPEYLKLLTANLSGITTKGATYTLAWYRGETCIGTGGQYRVTAEDVGSVITLKVSGTGCYYGTLSTEVSVSKTDIGAISVEAIEPQYYTSEKLTPAPVLNYLYDKGCRYQLQDGVDFIVQYSDNILPGTAAATLTGIGCFSGTQELHFTISRTPLSIVSADKLPAQIYCGAPFTPAVTLRHGNVTLSAGTDYSAAYSDETEPGTAYVTLTGIGNYIGTLDVPYSIVGIPLNEAVVTLTQYEVPYTGSIQTPDVQSVVLNGTVLTGGVDYQVTYANNQSEGIATVTVEGIGHYHGIATSQFLISGHLWSPWKPVDENTHTHTCLGCGKTETAPHSYSAGCCIDCGRDILDAKLSCTYVSVQGQSASDITVFAVSYDERGAILEMNTMTYPTGGSMRIDFADLTDSARIKVFFLDEQLCPVRPALVFDHTVGQLHSYTGKVTVPPTCSEIGIRTYTCSVCGDSYSEELPMLEHTVVKDSAVSPTCDADGLTEGSHCSVCRQVLEEQTVIPKLEHKIVNQICEYCGRSMVFEALKQIIIDHGTLSGGKYYFIFAPTDQYVYSPSSDTIDISFVFQDFTSVLTIDAKLQAPYEFVRSYNDGITAPCVVHSHLNPATFTDKTDYIPTYSASGGTVYIQSSLACNVMGLQVILTSINLQFSLYCSSKYNVGDLGFTGYD